MTDGQPDVVTYGPQTIGRPSRASSARRSSCAAEPPLIHHIYKFTRCARWHGIKDGVEGNYISTGDDLVLADSPEGSALFSDMHSEKVGKPSRSGTGAVGYRWTWS